MGQRLRKIPKLGAALWATIALCACSDRTEGGDGDGDTPGDGDGDLPFSGGSTGSGGSAGSGSATSSGSNSGSGSNDGSGGTDGNGSGASPGVGGNPEPDTACGSTKWACWPMPNEPGSGLPNEASYTNNGDGTVLDEVTGLVWEVSPPQTQGTWDDALNYCEALSLGGADDWRLPTRIEMTSVLDYGKPGWSEDAFPGASGGFHRSASDWVLTIDQIGAGAGTDFAWAFNMSDGIVSNAYSKESNARYRCVRSEGSGEAPSSKAVQPPDMYTEIAAGEIRDNYTGLTWEQGDSEAVDHLGAIAYCESLALGGHSWRLPSIRELATLVDEAEVAPSIDSSMFPDTKYGSRSNNWYWASDPDSLSDAAWALNFDDGFTGTNKGAAGSWNYFTAGFARCVR